MIHIEYLLNNRKDEMGRNQVEIINNQGFQENPKPLILLTRCDWIRTSGLRFAPVVPKRTSPGRAGTLRP